MTSSSQVAVLPGNDLLGTLRETLASREVLVELVKRDLKVRYKRSSLGLLWTMLNPLLMMSVTTIAFSQLFRFAIHNFPIYMMTAYVIWGFFAQGTISASSSVHGGAALAKKIYVPTGLFPIASVAGAALNMVLSLVPLGLLVIVTGGQFSWALLSLPLTLMLGIAFTLGVGFILAASAVFFHDVIHTFQAVLMAWMYLTPIFYPVEIVPEQWQLVFHLNPLLYFIEIVRDPVYSGVWPNAQSLAIAAGYAVVMLALGWWYFERCRNAFTSYL